MGELQNRVARRRIGFGRRRLGHTSSLRDRQDSSRTLFTAIYYVFDVLAVDGEPTTALPYLERRKLLDDLGMSWRRVQVPPFWTGVDGDRMLDLAREHHLEGVVAKRIDSYLDHEDSKDLIHDFHRDTARWEMSRLIRIAAVAQSKLDVRIAINQITDAARQTPDEAEQQLLRIIHHVAQETLPPRAKHDERRSGCPTCSNAALKRLTMW